MRRAAAQLLEALDAPLPQDWKPVGAVVVFRCVDQRGRRRIATRYAGDVMWWECLGMLATTFRDLWREDVPYEDPR